MKKILIIVAVVIVAGGAALYFFVFRTPAEKPEVRIEYSPGDFFVTNVGEGSNRMLKATIVLIVNDEAAIEVLAAQNTRIRDTIIFILRALTEEEIRAGGRKDELRNDIIKQLNEMLAIDNIVEVLFNDFVMS